jgi:transposase
MIAASTCRCYQGILDNFPNGFPNTILVSDCWAAQLKTPILSKQICLSHIQRDLKYFIQSCKNRWSKRFLKLIYEALELKKHIIQNPSMKHSYYLWTFLDHLDVPPDYNGAERAIRHVKVKQKVSGQFRSEKGAQQFAIIRSVYDEIRKNNGKAFDALSLVANFVPV